MTDNEIRRIEDAITKMDDRLTKQIEELRKEVTEASRFADGFQSVAKTLAYVLATVVALATIYGALAR